MVRKVLLAAPRGYCAGVDRAIEVVRRALAHFGSPLYVRKQIVHNEHVIAELEREGAVFVDSESDVPRGETLVLSAHGVSPAVRASAKERNLRVVDATCPLVSKVHAEAVRFARAGYTIVLIGHRDHEEVEGTLGEAPDRTVVIETAEHARRLQLPRTGKLAYLTQTTLSVDDTQSIVDVLKERFPDIVGPPSDDICYATSNRQAAVKALAISAQLVLVVGSRNSSNSQRLVDTARAAGAASYLIEDETAIEPDWLADVETVGVTAGASAPEVLVQRVCAWLRMRGAADIEEIAGPPETLVFAQPAELRAGIDGARPEPASSRPSASAA